MSGPMKLVFRNGPRADEEIEVDREMVLGREGADIEIEDSAVSRRHAIVRPSDDHLEIEDLDSTNGTFVNGARIDSPTTLSPGDFVNIGQSTLEFAGFDWRSAETQALSLPQDAPEEPDEYVPTAPISIEAGEPKGPLSSIPRPWIVAAAAILCVLVAVVAVSALTGGPSREEFLSEADALCREPQTSLRGVKLGAGEKPAALARDADRLLRARTSAIAAVRKLEVPEDMKPRVTTYLDRTEGTNAGLRALQRLKAKAKKPVAKRAVASVKNAARTEKKAARDAGLRVCGGLPV